MSLCDCDVGVGQRFNSTQGGSTATQLDQARPQLDSRNLKMGRLEVAQISSILTQWLKIGL